MSVEDVRAGLEPMGRRLDDEILAWYEAAPSRLVGTPDWWLETGDRVEFDDCSIDTADYTSRGFLASEQERLWPRAWLMACRANDIPRVGDFLEYEIAGHSIVVVRDAPDSITAFRNACRHRGAALVSGSGSTDCFVCRFHAWTYGLDGALVQMPAHWDFPHVDVATAGLHRVQAQAFDGWVFINMDPDAASLEDHLGETVMRHLRSQPVRSDAQLWKEWHYGVVLKANWKVMAEAFFEIYHGPRTHPQLMPWAPDYRDVYLDARQNGFFGLHHRLFLSPFGRRPRPDVTDEDCSRTT